MANISMTEFSLHCHPTTETATVARIDGEIASDSAGTCHIVFRLLGRLSDIDIAKASAASRTDGLWRSTCFELFLKRPDDTAYLEFNFAPSSQWAAYAFDDYREGMTDLTLDAPSIKAHPDGDTFELRATFQLPAEWQMLPMLAGVSAVIKDVDGFNSYWAIAHPAGKPDFHHKDCFALQVDARSAA